MNSKEKILSAAIVLFAQKGYSGLSMRQLALAVDLSVAAIYHHFPDKKTLYLESVRFAFSSKEEVFAQVWESNCSAEEKLGGFVRSLVDVIIQDRDFHSLMQREILEADPERMQLLAQGVFKSQFCLLMQLAAELAPEQDAHMVAASVIGLAKSYVEYQPLLKNFPGWKPEHEIPEVIAAHVTKLLINSFKAKTA
ncbi:MAG: TetR/AcrR family transcriptional regulator [Methylococcales bacterium]|nr:TetR/AcrR family transcriptional regulator [Methylococcales bacterium]MDD5633199.1 TetR/AcrR family transcriptional regulator [Methylococcales bacterium]